MRTISAILFFFLLSFSVPAAMAGPFIGASVGIAYSSTDAPELTMLSGGVENSDGQGFSRLAVIGYRTKDGLSAALSYGIAGEFSSITSASDSSVGLSVETSRRGVDCSFLSLTAGKFIFINGDVGIDVNAGIVSWQRDTKDRSTYVLRDFPAGPIVDALDVSSAFSDRGLNGTAGIFIIVHGVTRIGVQYYGGLDMTVPMAGIDYSF